VNGNAQLHEFHLDKVREGIQDLLEHHEGHAVTHLARAALAFYEERWQDAIDSLRISTELPGFFAPSRWFLAQLLYYVGRFREALTEVEVLRGLMGHVQEWCFQQMMILAETDGLDAAQAAYRHWVDEYGDTPFISTPSFGLHYDVHCFFGHREEGIRISRQHRARATPAFHEDSFDIALGQYMCGELSHEQLLDAAGSRTQKNRAHDCIGLTRLADGDRVGAIQHFTDIERAGNWLFSVNVGSPMLPESFLLLERLRADPTWPPWIPMRDGVQQDVVTEPTGRVP
jgi:hypothetical protein